MKTILSLAVALVCVTVASANPYRQVIVQPVCAQQQVYTQAVQQQVYVQPQVVYQQQVQQVYAQPQFIQQSYGVQAQFQVQKFRRSAVVAGYSASVVVPQRERFRQRTVIRRR